MRRSVTQCVRIGEEVQLPVLARRSDTGGEFAGFASLDEGYDSAVGETSRRSDKLAKTFKGWLPAMGH